MSRGKGPIYAKLHPEADRGAAEPGSEIGEFRISPGPGAAEHKGMGHAQRIQTYDDNLHERRRQLAIVREPIDFEAARLKKLIEKARDTRDP